MKAIFTEMENVRQFNSKSVRPNPLNKNEVILFRAIIVERKQREISLGGSSNAEQGHLFQGNKGMKV